MARRVLSYLIRVMLVSAVIVPAAWLLLFRTTTGHWFPIQQVEQLQSPVSVDGWSADGLRLKDGRLLPLPGVIALPAESASLAESIKHGVEISPDGGVFGLVRVHHWCGNDPVREHLAKVSLGDMLVFLGEATPLVPLELDYEVERLPESRRFTKHGWNISDFMHFEIWQHMKRWELTR